MDSISDLASISEPIDPHRNYAFKDAARITGVSRRTIYRLADTGRLRTVRILRRRLVPGTELIRIRDQGCD